jgi:hypothetical protein
MLQLISNWSWGLIESNPARNSFIFVCKRTIIYWSSQFNCWGHLVWILDVNSYCEGTSLSTSSNIFSRKKDVAPTKWCWQQSVQQNIVLVCRTTDLSVLMTIYNDDASQCGYNNNAQCMYSELQAYLFFV